MNDYEITFARSARKELEELDSVFATRIFRKIVSLAGEPRPKGCAKLVGNKNLWRIRIGEYRVIYSIYDRESTIDVVAVRHRSEAYK